MRYTPSHEWIRTEIEMGQEVSTVGITSYARDELGQVVYVELPLVGDFIEMGEEVAVVESTKAAVDIYSPATGEVIAVNEALPGNLDLLNSSPETLGWLFKMKVANQKDVEELLGKEEYLLMIGS